MHPPADLLLSIEDGPKPPTDLSDYNPLSIVVVIAFVHTTVKAAA